MTLQSILFGEPIHTYTRADALADGTLVDLATVAPSACRYYKWPVACTESVYAHLERARRVAPWTDWEGLVHDLLFMSNNAPGRRKVDHSTVIFSVLQPRDGIGRTVKRTYWIECGPGDNGEPVITIYQEGER